MPDSERNFLSNPVKLFFLKFSASYKSSNLSAGTSMFVFGIAKGVKEGWLHPDFIYVAWQGLKGMLSKISENGDVTAICVGTGIMPSTVFYYNRPTQENDPMGEGPVLRALVEMIDAPKYTEISANDQYDKIK